VGAGTIVGDHGTGVREHMPQQTGELGVDRVWMYWEHDPGHPRAPYLDLCRRTIEHRLDALSLQVVDDRTVRDLLPDLDEVTWSRLPDPVRRSDYCRVRLVHRYGGLYLDADCLALAPLSRLLEPLVSVPFVTYGTPGGLLQNNLFAARAGSELLGCWMDAQDELLHDADVGALGRTALGEPLLTPLAARLEHHRFPERVVAPVMWYEWGRFFSKTTPPNWVLRHAPLTVMLYNEFMGTTLRDVPEEELLRGRTLLSRLFRIALGQSTPDAETDFATRLHLGADLVYSPSGRAAMGRLRRLRARLGPGGRS
jgi:Glycosyltransferase sugar-binding region containing DXD motif